MFYKTQVRYACEICHLLGENFTARKLAGLRQFCDLQCVFFTVICIPVLRQSSTEIWPVIPYLYSTMGSSKLDQVNTNALWHSLKKYYQKYIFRIKKVQKASQLIGLTFFFDISLLAVLLLVMDRYAQLRLSSFMIHIIRPLT